MQIDLTRLETAADHPSIRISYDSQVQAHYIHRDFRGPYNTLVRVCLLRIPDSVSPTTRHYLDMLTAEGVVYGGGYCRVRHTVEVRHLIRCIWSAMTQAYPRVSDVEPSPDNPILPDHEATVPAEFLEENLAVPLMTPQEASDFLAHELRPTRRRRR